LNYALDFANRNGSKLIILHAWDLPHQKSAMLVTIKNQIQEQAHLDMKTLTNKIRNNPKFENLELESFIMMGDAAEVIKQVAKVKNADLIIMGTTGAGGIKKLLMGSNASAVIEDAPCPVLAIPADSEFNLVKKILYATDFKNDGLSALNKLVDFARILDAEIMVTHISDEENNKEEEFNKFKEEVIQNLDYPKISFSYFYNSSIIEGLNQLLMSDDIQMLAMLTKKRGFFEKVFHKSFTKEMAFAATAPLLAFQYSTEKAATA
jgi:nucleotide-binding universal stress UspA family protein